MHNDDACAHITCAQRQTQVRSFVRSFNARARSRSHSHLYSICIQGGRAFVDVSEFRHTLRANVPHCLGAKHQKGFPCTTSSFTTRCSARGERLVNVDGDGDAEGLPEAGAGLVCICVCVWVHTAGIHIPPAGVNAREHVVLSR